MIYDGTRSEGVNPFGTKQTAWEVVEESALETFAFDDYKDFCSGFKKCFPEIISVDLGTFQGEGTDIWEMGFYDMEVNGKYYFLGFHATLGSVWG